MKNIFVSIFIAISLCFSFGCAAKAPSAEANSNGFYGEYPSNYKELIAEYAGEILLDPYSAHYEFQGEPEKVWIHNDGKTYFYGWGGNVYINAKNRFGGYVGKELYEYFIQGTYVRIWRVGFTPNIHYVYQ